MLASDSYIEKLAIEGYSKFQTAVPIGKDGEPAPLFSKLSEKERLGWKNAVKEIISNLNNDGLLIG